MATERPMCLRENTTTGQVGVWITGGSWLGLGAVDCGVGAFRRRRLQRRRKSRCALGKHDDRPGWGLDQRRRLAGTDHLIRAASRPVAAGRQGKYNVDLSGSSSRTLGITQSARSDNPKDQPHYSDPFMTQSWKDLFRVLGRKKRKVSSNPALRPLGLNAVRFIWYRAGHLAAAFRSSQFRANSRPALP